MPRGERIGLGWFSPAGHVRRNSWDGGGIRQRGGASSAGHAGVRRGDDETRSWTKYRAKDSTVNRAPSLRKPARCYRSPDTCPNRAAMTPAVSPSSAATRAGSCSHSGRQRPWRPGPSWGSAARRSSASAPAARHTAAGCHGHGRRTPAPTRYPVTGGAPCRRARPVRPATAGHCGGSSITSRAKPCAFRPHSGHGRPSTQVQSLASGTIVTARHHTDRASRSRRHSSREHPGQHTTVNASIATATSGHAADRALLAMRCLTRPSRQRSRRTTARCWHQPGRAPRRRCPRPQSGARAERG